jgi:hypothetical protein
MPGSTASQIDSNLNGILCSRQLIHRMTRTGDTSSLQSNDCVLRSKTVRGCNWNWADPHFTVSAHRRAYSSNLRAKGNLLEERCTERSRVSFILQRLAAIEAARYRC